MTSPTITLIMIVKNESKIIERCLNSVKDFIDYVVISDTGSTDNTPEIIESYLSRNNIKGAVYRDQWKNFGYNRTKSLTNGQDWLDKRQIDKTKNYFITIDADMILVLNNFNKKQLLEKQSWSLLQMNNSIKYYNMRLFRSDLHYKCLGVTHEYWGCDGNPSEGKFEGMYIDDRGDGGCKSDKFTRDIELLTKGLEEEPSNHRYYFYLAQSYGDSGDFENAIKWYKKRVEAGGWFEEVFISYKRIGELYMELKQEENAVFYWLKAYEHIPQRSETLYKLANHYRNKSNNNTSIMFIKQGLSIPYPNDLVLFLEYQVYEHKFIEELGIVGYYVNKKHEGLLACQYLLLTKEIPEGVRNNASNNLYFYLNKLSEKNRSHQVLEFKVDQPYISSSPCLLYDSVNKKYKGVVRTVNYSIDDSFTYHIRDENNNVKTKNYWTELNEDGKVETLYEINNLTKPIRNSHIKGFEDVRICYVGDKLYGFAVDWENGTHNHPSVILLHFNLYEDKYVIDKAIHINYMDHICQKNWTLFSDSNKLYAIYSHNPLTILEINPENGSYNVKTYPTPDSYKSYNIGDMRGSANPLKLASGDWLVLVHEVMYKYNTRKYYHRFLRYSSNWELTNISEPFYFNNLFVEFSLSIMYDFNNNDLIISYSSRDNSSELMKIKFNNIPWMPKDIKKYLIDTL